MELLNLLYNIFLLLLYSIPLTLGFVLYFHRKKRIYLYTCILFIAFIVDNITIYMTELLPWFSRLYDHMLLSVPTVKTLLYLVTLGCMLLILAEKLEIGNIRLFWASLILIVLFQLYTPLFPDNPWKIWIYYFPAQLFMFCIGAYGIHTQRKKPEYCSSESERLFFKVLVFYALMAVAITIEDSIVIFCYDVCTPLEVEIQKRSFTQDFMNIGLSVYMIRLLFSSLSQALTAVPEESSQGEPGETFSVLSGLSENSEVHTSVSTLSHPDEPVRQPENIDDTSSTSSGINSKPYRFAKEYSFTAREQEILFLLLENKNNQEISDELMISIGTTKAHVHNIFQKLEIRKRQQLFDLYQNFEPKES